MRAVRELLVVCTALLVCAAAVAHRNAEAARATEELRARWAAMPEATKERMRSRYAELEQLSAPEQQTLRRRASRMDELARRVYGTLEEDERERLDGLGADKRRELLREMAVAEAQSMGERILEMLPPEDRARLESASAEDRELFFLEFDKRQRRRMDEAIEEHGPDFLHPTDLERLRRLGPDERRGKFLEIVQRRTVRWIETTGLPEGLSERRWQVLAAMQPAEFWHAWERARDRHGFEGPIRRNRRPHAAHLIERALKVDPEQHLLLAELPPDERQPLLQAEKRRRVVEAVRRNKLVDEEGLSHLEGCTDAEFFLEVRQMMEASRRDESENGRGPGRGGGPGRRDGDE